MENILGAVLLVILVVVMLALVTMYVVPITHMALSTVEENVTGIISRTLPHIVDVYYVHGARGGKLCIITSTGKTTLQSVIYCGKEYSIDKSISGLSITCIDVQRYCQYAYIRIGSYTVKTTVTVR